MEVREFNYNEKNYKMLLPRVRQCMQLSNRIAVLLGGVLGTLKKDSKDGGMEAFALALQGIDPEKVDAIFMDAVRESKLGCNGADLFNETGFERHFGQYRSDTYPVCAWCVWECVRDFFPQSGAFAQVAKAAAEKAFLSQMGGGTSSGGSAALSGKESAPGPKLKTGQ